MQFSLTAQFWALPPHWPSFQKSDQAVCAADSLNLRISMDIPDGTVLNFFVIAENSTSQNLYRNWVKMLVCGRFH